jgi:tetratricopeptide (TPR) repeat protein
MLNKAFEQMKKAYAIDPSDDALLSEMALDYYYSRRYQDAIETFELKAVKGLAGKGDPMLIGKSYYQLKNWTKCDSVFSNVITNSPDDMQAYVYLARTYSNMDPTSELGLAAPKFQLLIDKASSDSVKFKQELFEAFSYMGYFNLQKKEYEPAKVWYNRLLNLDDKNKDWQIKALSSLALISYREKDYVEAKTCYVKLLQLDPNNKEFKEAIVNLDKVITAQKR